MLRRPMLLCALIGTLLVASLALARSADDPYVLVRVDLTSPVVQYALEANPGLDIGDIKTGSHAEVITSLKDREWMRATGVPFEIIVEDMEAYYARRFEGERGDYGVYHTWSEIVTWLDDLHAAYPNVVSQKWSIGQSHEGNDLWCVRVSDNPEMDEPGEPEVLFDGMHHAREIMASEMPMMLIEHLASNYGTDPRITWLLDNREVYVVPVVNPDGSLYNEAVQPDGGGMWRKNRRDNGDGSWGVDPNRNYPYEWVGPGSSTDTSSDTYRGPAPGSEPEIQAMMALINAHEFVVGQSFHSYSDLVLYPWGHTTDDSPDHDVFTHMAGIMVRDNGYEPGQPGEALWYTVNGGSFDWFYGATDDHDKCFSFTSEIGSSSDGFWPDQDRRDALFLDNLEPSIYQIAAAGLYLDAHAPVVVGGDGNGRLDAGETAAISFTMENLGVTTAASAIEMTFSCDDPYVLLGETTRTVGPLAAMGTLSLAGDPIPVTVNTALPASRTVVVHVAIEADGVNAEFDLNVPAGTESVLFADDFDRGGAGNWTLTGSWGVTTDQSHSPSSSLTDTPTGSYDDDATTSATMTVPVTLGAGGTLSFWHRYDIEDGYDYGYVQASSDGVTWITLASYTDEQSGWTLEELSLDDFAGDDVRVRFQLVTDYSVTRDGWYIDDVVITGGGSTNAMPPAPTLLAPQEGELVPQSFAITCGTVVDPEGSDVTYGFRIFGTSDFTDLVLSDQGVEAVEGQATITVDTLTPGATYWVRAFAADDEAWGLMGPARSFTVDTALGVDLPLGRLALRSLGGSADGSARLQLALPQAGDLQVLIFNARGQQVRTLAAGAHQAGRHLLTWDGRDESGRAVASGVYLVRAVVGRETAVARVLMVR